MKRIPWRRTLHLLQHQQRSLLPSLAPTSRSSSTTPLSEELCSRTASWALSTREAHFSSREHLSGGCTRVCGSRIGDDLGLSNGRRNFHATGFQHMSRQNFDETSGLQNAKEVKSAIYETVKEWYLDSEKVNAEARKKVREIQQAYEALTDDEKQALHDQAFLQSVLKSGGGGRRGFGLSEETLTYVSLLSLLLVYIASK